MVTKDQVMATVTRIFSQGLLKVLSSDPREAALAAWVQGGPSVDELEARIREMQAVGAVVPSG